MRQREDRGRRVWEYVQGEFDSRSRRIGICEKEAERVR